MSYSARLQITPALSLEEVYKTLKPEPLEGLEQLKAFYREEINAVRGGNKMRRIQLRLNRAYQDRIPYKACVMGHRGVGKTTELSRLIEDVKPQFCTIRLSAVSSLDPGSFKSLDVLLLMMAEIAERTAQPIERGGTGQRPSDRRLQEIWDWFAIEKATFEQTKVGTVTAEAGIGVKDASLWAKVTGLFATLKGEIKFAATRKQEVVEYRLNRMSSLIEVANRLLDECNELLRSTRGQQWLFVAEDFDRAGIPSARIEELFITYANIFQDLRVSMIFTLPISLYYSESAARLPFAGDCSFVIPDTPVYHSNPG